MNKKNLLSTVLLFAAVVMTSGTAHADFPLDQWGTGLFTQFTVTDGSLGVTEDADHTFNTLLGQSPYLLYTYGGTDSPASFIINYGSSVTTDFITVEPGTHTVALNSDLGNHSFWVNSLDFKSTGHAEYIIESRPGQVVTPEPAAMALFAMGGIPMGLAFLRRRKTLSA